jgi:predicted ferric reductase
MAIWEMIRASGLMAYGLLSLAVIFGVGVRVRAFDWLMKRAWVFEAHQVLSVLAFAFSVAHVALLFANQHVRFNVVDVMLPFASAWKPLPTAMGVLAMYLLALLVATSLARGAIGERTWRLVHYGGFLAWLLALAHGVFAGHDSTVAWVQYAYLATGAAVLLLIIVRVLESKSHVAGSRKPHEVQRRADTPRFASPAPPR